MEKEEKPCDEWVYEIACECKAKQDLKQIQDT